MIGLIAVGVLAIFWVMPQQSGKFASEKISRSAFGHRNERLPVTDAAKPATKSPQPHSHAEQVVRWNAAFLTPIAFYGRVVDQHGEPIADADVKLSANDKPLRPTSEYSRKTDRDGRFSISGIVGLTLAVEVSKLGYRVIPPVYGKVTSSGLFEYGLSSRGPYRSSTDAPTIFTLHRVGHLEPLVKIGEKSFRMARDGTALSISLDERGEHQVVLRCWNQDLQRPQGQRQYDWRLEMVVPNGGLLARQDALQFEAPEDGYAPGETVEMPASLGHQWRSFAERSYFIRFDDDTFARANLRMRAAGDHFVVWESFYNPKPGSRNLENDPNQNVARKGPGG